MRHVAVIVLVVFAACDDESSLGIEVFPGPEMRVLEGKTVEHELRLDGERGRTFGFVGDASAMARLAVSTIEHDGGTFLRVTPRCTAVAAGATNSVLAHIEISAPNAAPVTVSVTIEPHESDECAVQVVGWLGPCTDRPPTIEPEIRLDPLTGAEQRICVHVSVPEPIASVDVTFPPWLGLAPLVISGEGLFGLAGPVEADRELVVTGVLGTFRGRRDIDVHWTGGGSARLVVTAGEPGDGVVGARNTLANVAEYKPGILKFATSYYDKPGTVACVRATPKAPTMTLVMRSDLDEIIAQGDLACGVTINAAELVTAMDSADAEEIDVTLERCTPDPLCVHPITVSACCAEVDTELIDGRTFLVRSRSVVEPIAVGQGGERACVDLDNDNAPEVVVRDAAGARLSVATGPPSNIRFAASIAMNETPQSMLAMSWFDGMKPRPILVGQFQTSPFLRLASPAGWAANEWAPRPTSVTGAHDWVPVAPSRDAGASYLAVRQGFTAIAFACVSPGSPGCRADATTIDIADIDMGPIATPQRVVGFTVADFDGDLDLDLVVAVDDMVPVVTTRPVKMYAYDLRWNGHEIESHSEPTAFSVASTGVAWTALQFATLPYADGDLIYLLATGGLTTAFVEISTCALGCRTSRVVHSIGRPYRIATVGNTLFAATELGIWELENGQSWIPRDPERMRTQGTTIPAPDPSSPYGQQLESCLVADPLTPPSILFDAEAGARWAFANVQVGTLPGP